MKHSGEAAAALEVIKMEEMGQDIGGRKGSVFRPRPVMSPCRERHKCVRTPAEKEAEGRDHTLLFYTGRHGRRLVLEVQCCVTIE